MTQTTLFPANLSATPPVAILAFFGRLGIATIFLLSGIGKAADPSGTVGYIASANLPQPHLALFIAISVELIGGGLLVIGYKARSVAAVLAVFTLTAAFGFHFDLADEDQFIHFFKNIAIAGGLAQIIAHGGGRLDIGGAG